MIIMIVIIIFLLSKEIIIINAINNEFNRVPRESSWLLNHSIVLVFFVSQMSVGKAQLYLMIWH